MNKLKLLENELVPVYSTDSGEKVVYGTELYSCLKSKRQYADWIKERFSECDAIENKDFESFSQKNEKPTGGRPKIEYIIKLNTAKEMAMLERNEVGKSVRKYFIYIKEKYKEEKVRSKIEHSAFLLKFIADDMRVNDASRLLMYENLCKDFNIPTGFLPKYEYNDNRQMKALSTLLKENGCGLSAIKFNQKLIEQGYLEERERPSSKGETKKFKALTESGLQYGENAVNPHNQKEVQPLYYSDVFTELYEKVI